MKPFTTLFAAALLALTTLVPAGASAEDRNVRLPFTADGGETAVAPAGGVTPLISFISSESASCHQPNPAVDSCLIKFPHLSVDAAPNYILYLTIELNGRLVARYSGFFQTSLNLTDSLGTGIKVLCGRRGDGGVATFGRKYDFIIRAEDSAALKAANYGTIYCPPFRRALP